MKTKLSLILLVSAALLVLAHTTTARGQSLPTFADLPGGLLGQTWTGVEFGYTHRVEGAPRALHRYGFVSSRPLIEHDRFDAAFRYDFLRGAAFGERLNRHDVAMSFTGYVPLPDAKPFVRADAGWVWSRAAGSNENGFAYLLGVGVEFRTLPRLAVAPYVNYREIATLSSRTWTYGAKAAYRFNVGWSGTFALQFDGRHNIEYALGAQRRF